MSRLHKKSKYWRRRTRKQLFCEDPTCFWCGEDVSLEYGENWAYIEHILPLCMGGTNDESNLALTHYKCRDGGL